MVEKHYCKLHSFTGSEVEIENCPDCNSTNEEEQPPEAEQSIYQVMEESPY